MLIEQGIRAMYIVKRVTKKIINLGCVSRGLREYQNRMNLDKLRSWYTIASDTVRTLLNINVTPEEQRVLDLLDASGVKSRKVVGRGTLVVDPIEITSSPEFAGYCKQARKIVERCKLKEDE